MVQFVPHQTLKLPVHLTMFVYQFGSYIIAYSFCTITFSYPLVILLSWNISKMIIHFCIFWFISPLEVGAYWFLQSFAAFFFPFFLVDEPCDSIILALFMFVLTLLSIGWSPLWPPLHHNCAWHQPWMAALCTARPASVKQWWLCTVMAHSLSLATTPHEVLNSNWL